MERGDDEGEGGDFPVKYSDLIVKSQGSLVIVILNRPKELNTLSVHMLKELKEVTLEFQNDPGIVLLS